MLSRKIIKIYNNIAQKHGNVTVKYHGKYEKLKYKQTRHRLSQQLQTTLCVSGVPYL